MSFSGSDILATVALIASVTNLSVVLFMCWRARNW